MLPDREEIPDPLAEAMIARSGDLAHFMLRGDIPVAMAQGTTPNGTEVTVLYAIGEHSDMAADFGAALVSLIERERIARRAQGLQN